MLLIKIIIWYDWSKKPIMYCTGYFFNKAMDHTF